MQLSKITIFTSLLVVTLLSSKLNLGKEKWKEIIDADPKGYCAYLPAVFIYEDVNFGFFDFFEKEKYYNENFFTITVKVPMDMRSTANMPVPLWLVCHFFIPRII